MVGVTALQERREKILSVQQCAQLCRDTMPCISFSYRKAFGTCKLHYQGSEQMKFQKHQSYEFYEYARKDGGNHKYILILHNV